MTPHPNCCYIAPWNLMRYQWAIDAFAQDARGSHPSAIKEEGHKD